jgi:subtilase family serine protease
MKSQKKFFCLVLFFSISLAFLIGGVSFAIEKDMESPTEIPSDQIPSKDIKEKKKYEPRVLKIVKPDLIVERIDINNFSSDADSRQVKVTVYIKNKGTASTGASLTADGTARGSRGECKARIDWTDNPALGWNRLCEAGVSALAAGATFNFFCNDDVPKGTSRKYRATVDILDWISELDEVNNVHAAGFVSH